MSKPTYDELVRAIRDCRFWQRTYYSFGFQCVEKTAALNKSKAAEKRIDALLEAFDSPQETMEVGE